MRWTIGFTDPGCEEIAVVGGKGANLARLASAGLPVPAGLCVTTDAYATFVDSAGLASAIADAAARAGASPEELEAATGTLRDKLTAAPLPEAIDGAIRAGYAELGEDPYVAVRSSGTAEDLADASFAGLHDTYLDIRGADEVVDAVRRCWASMWTARATAYRSSRGFDQAEARIAVVVQRMVETDVAGVMFTANPLNGATDEIVINASYGLGEALVSGIATPDQHVLVRGDLRVREQHTGEKQVRVMRDPDAGSGTVTREVPAEERPRLALTATQVHELAGLGERVMTHYGGVPQDIEWGIADGELHLLQSRPVTGSEFSWDEDLEFWQRFPPGGDDSILWSGSFARELWNGGISPFTYSYRGAMFTQAIERSMKLWGVPRLTAPVFRYHRGTAYYNTAVEERLVTETALAPFRVGLLAHVAPDRHDEVLGAPLALWRYLRMHLRIAAIGRPVHGARNFYRTVDEYLEERRAEADGMTAAQLAELRDDALIAEAERVVRIKAQFTEDLWTGFFIFARDAAGLLAGVIAAWYDPDPEPVLSALLSGLPERTATARENGWLWQLAERIRRSPELTRAFERAGVDYLEAFEASAEGREFIAEYRRFLAANPDRGHADRDIYYPRRADDPAIDHATFATLLNAGDAPAPEEREREVDARRNATIAEIEAALGAQRLGGVRVKVFRTLLDYVHRFFLYRDNQRRYFDRYTYAMRRCTEEIGRRLAGRGVLERPDDIYFLGRNEVYPLLRGEAAPDARLPLKIAGRRANFERMASHEANLPAYLRAGRPVRFDAEDEGDGLTGTGTSRGTVTGRARIIRRLSDIGQVEPDDILVTVSTDPGWTPVFTMLSGIVLETGGMLAHGSCLAREYGFPAVQLARATSVIPDGATITVNGDDGTVTIGEGQPAPELVEG